MNPSEVSFGAVNNHFSQNEAGSSSSSGNNPMAGSAERLAQQSGIHGSALSNVFQATMALKKVGVHQHAGPNYGLRKVSLISPNFFDSTATIYKKTYTLSADGNNVLVKDKVLDGAYRTLSVARKKLSELDPTQQSLLKGVSGNFVANRVSKRDLVLGDHEKLKNHHIVAFQVGKSMKFSDRAYDCIIHRNDDQYNTDEQSFDFNEKTNLFSYLKKELGDQASDDRIVAQFDFSKDKATPEFLALFFGGEGAIHNWNANVSRQVALLEAEMDRADERRNSWSSNGSF